jgi:hypothetical protein
MDRRDFLRGALAVPMAAALPAFVAAAPALAVAAVPQFTVTNFEALGHFTDEGIFAVDEWRQQFREDLEFFRDEQWPNPVSPTA